MARILVKLFKRELTAVGGILQIWSMTFSISRENFFEIRQEGAWSMNEK
jgi:hypothetical protein